MAPKQKVKKDTPTKGVKQQTLAESTVTSRRRSGKQQEEASKPQGTSQSSTALVNVKQELPPPDAAQRAKMLAKLHYDKNHGKSEAFNEYQALDVQGKRAWFFNVYQKDPSLSKFNAHVKQRTVFGTEQSKEAELWLTEKQIMTNNGFLDDKADDYQVVKDALLKGLEERDHENANLAALGWKQYRTVQKSQELLTGKTKQDVLHLEHEITSKDARLIRDAFDSGSVAAPEPEKPAVMIEPWKKDAMDLERRLQSLTTKGDKLCRDAQKIMNQLRGLVDSSAAGHPLAAAQCDEIDDKKKIFEVAGRDFVDETWKWHSRTKDDARVQAEQTEEPMKIYKQHIANFEKLLNLAKSLLSLQTA